MPPIEKSVSDEELSGWAERRADDAGRLSRELVQYRARVLELEQLLKASQDDNRHLRGNKGAGRWL